MLALTACAMPNVQRATVESQPTNSAVRNITSFTNSLRCMDDLFLSYGKKDIVITSDGLPDKTGQITTGTKEMMISAISIMSTKSGAFRFVDVDRTQDSLFWIQENWIGVRDGLLAPNYYVRGAITQVDAGVMNDNQSAGFSIPQFSIGVARDRLVSVVSMDLNIGDVVTRQIKPGLSSTNSIAVVKSGRGGDTEGLIDKAGLFFEISNDRSQGSHQSVRTLVELGLIEVLGKLTQVPYWRCLEIESTNPEMIAQARDWYDGMSTSEQIVLSKNALRRYGLFFGAADIQKTPAFLKAVNQYKVENNLIADGRIDFDLYYSFLVNNLAVQEQDKPVEELAANSGSSVIPPNNAPPRSPSAGNLSLKLEPEGGTNRVFQTGEPFSFMASVAQDAYLYCYYQDHSGTVARVFPSRFQTDPKIAAGQLTQVPSPNAGFVIGLEESGVTEQIACIATEKAYGPKKPFVLEEEDLTALEVESLAEVVDQHLDADRFNTSVQYLPIMVR